MIITLLAIGFLLFLVLIMIIGKMTVLKKSDDPNDAFSEKCSICREKFLKTNLIEQQIGDYKMLYFCRDCIEKLASDGKRLSH